MDDGLHVRKVENGRYFRILTIIGQFSHKGPFFWADLSLPLTCPKVVAFLNVLAGTRGLPIVITVDNGLEFCSRAMDVWSYRNGVKLDVIRLARQVENGFTESFNGQLCDECLNVHVFFDLADAKKRLEAWRHNYNQVPPHGSLGKLTPSQFARRSGPQGAHNYRPKIPLPASH